MELKKVTNQVNKNYAKKDKVTKNELKAATPHKWIVAATTGFVTLFYTSPKRSIYQIGVVFGCIEIAVNYNYTPLFNTLNKIMDICYYGVWTAGISLCLSILIGVFSINNKEKQKKITIINKYILFIGIILAIITGILVFILKQDVPAFFEGGIKKAI